MIIEMLTAGVITAGSGRGFVVEGAGERLVITAAHCVAADGRQLPPAHPFSYTKERLYQRLLGPLGKAKPKVWAMCLFAAIRLPTLPCWVRPTTKSSPRKPKPSAN